MDNRNKRVRRYDDDDDSNLGDLTLNTDGNLSIGIGGGLSIDAEDGSLGMQVGGFTVDFDSD